MTPAQIIAAQLAYLEDHRPDDDLPTDREIFELEAEQILEALIENGYRLTSYDPTEPETSFVCRLDGLELDVSDTTAHLDHAHSMTLDEYIAQTSKHVAPSRADILFADMLDHVMRPGSATDS